MRDGVGAMRGDVDSAITADFPGIALWSLYATIPQKRSHREVGARLRDLDDRLRTVAATGLRGHPVATAYRGFARQVGLDPDVDRNPLERLVIERVRRGRFRSSGRLADALAVAMLETGVPLWAVDGDAVHGWLSVGAEAAGRLVVRDERRPLAELLLDPAADAAAGPSTTEAIVYALRLGRAVPDVAVEEALWHVRANLGTEVRS